MFCTSGVPTGTGPVVAHSRGLLINTPFIGLPLHPVLLPCSLTCLLEQVASPKSLSKHLFLWTPKSSFTFLSHIPLVTADQKKSGSFAQSPGPSPKSASALPLPLCSLGVTSSYVPHTHSGSCPAPGMPCHSLAPSCSLLNQAFCLGSLPL